MRSTATEVRKEGSIPLFCCSLARLTSGSVARVDADGFISIKDTLQCLDGPQNVFACGDVASCNLYPRPKAGVFAVRQGLPLATNLRKCVPIKVIVLAIYKGCNC